MKLRSLLSILLFICSVTFSIAQTKAISLKQRKYTSVSLNTNLSAEIGEKLIENGVEYFQDAYRITKIPKDFSITLLEFPYKVGDILYLGMKYKSREFYYDESKIIRYSSMPTYTIGISKDTITGNYLPYAKSVNGFKEKHVEGFTAEPTTYVDQNCSNCIKREFVFNGKVGNALKFVYREYVGDMARPAFSQDLQYDLSEGNIVGIKGLRLEVIKVTNTNIDYKILSSFTN